MKDKKIIQRYINNFRRHFSLRLKPNIGLLCNAYPVESVGAILEFVVGPEISSSDEFKEIEPTINDALVKIPQKAFGGNLKGFKFGGTNIIIENNRVIIIKGQDNEAEWNDQATQADIKRIQSPKADGVR